MNVNIKFEDAMERLEKIVRELESGALSLDDSISAYEEAVGLIKLCNARLEGAEQRVRVLVQSADGSVTDKDFIVEDEN